MRSSQTQIKFLEQSGEVVLKSTAEIGNLCNFTWAEKINGEPDFSKTTYLQPHQQIAENSAKLILTKISSEVGYGVLSDKASARIEAHQIVCIYEGEILSGVSGVYRLGAVNPLYRGNIARFVDHLPTTFELLQYEFKQPLTPSDVAVANLDIDMIDLEAVFPALVSNRVIEPGEIIGYSYNDHYWKFGNIEPKLFTRAGKVIDPTLYSKSTSNQQWYELIKQPLEKIQESGYIAAQQIDHACSKSASFEEYNATLSDMIMSFFSCTENKESIFWMVMYLEHIINLLEQTTLQFPKHEQSNTLKNKIKPFKRFFRLFDESAEDITMENIDNIADEMEKLFENKSLEELQLKLAPHHEKLIKFKLQRT